VAIDRVFKVEVVVWPEISYKRVYIWRVRPDGTRFYREYPSWSKRWRTNGDYTRRGHLMQRIMLEDRNDE
jgi:hypothetical protein